LWIGPWDKTSVRGELSVETWRRAHRPGPSKSRLRWPRSSRIPRARPMYR